MLAQRAAVTMQSESCMVNLIKAVSNRVVIGWRLKPEILAQG